MKGRGQDAAEQHTFTVTTRISTPCQQAALTPQREQPAIAELACYPRARLSCTCSSPSVCCGIPREFLVQDASPRALLGETSTRGLAQWESVAEPASPEPVRSH